MTKRMEDHGAARLALCEALADELGKATGDEWIRDDSAAFQEDSWLELGDPAGFRGSVFRRTGDGFAVRVTVCLEYNRGDRVTARIDWPDDPTESGAGRAQRLRNAPGCAYDTPEPMTTAAADRPARAVARQIARELVTVEHADAWAALEGQNAARLALRDTAADWRAKVGAALTGNLETADLHPSGVYRAKHDSRWHGPSPRAHPVGLDLRDPEGNRPGGIASVDLPEDPDAGARHMCRRWFVNAGLIVTPVDNCHLDNTDRAIAGRLEDARRALPGPRVGDFVQLPEQVQPVMRICGLGFDGERFGLTHGGSFSLPALRAPAVDPARESTAGYSGGLDWRDGWRLDRLEDTGHIARARFWFFSHGQPGAGCGVDVALDARVFRLRDE